MTIGPRKSKERATWPNNRLGPTSRQIHRCRGLKIGARTEFLVIGDVIPGHEDTLRQVLNEHMANPRTQDAVNEIGTLHEARFVLMDGGKRLMFCSSFDGDWDKYIDDFAATAIGLNFDESWNAMSRL